ncbi:MULTISPECIES: HAD hydrolase-like protein [Arthrobacter]|uniref:HAD hydrolase-like protein n=2 Tax=Arthrobacter TaxID=1663 RepID=A0ABU9KIA8_9MICC|nr:HAD hydrolase-like protein [Arthrobacter sp. YJM1]MDP5226113.1 HAD hydrolase-like protein [Arthrobacter sp. YJM1]
MTLTRPAVIFDLDGTLVDPAGGITGGISLALEETGLPVPGDAALHAMVGPRLSQALQELAGVPAHRVEEVIAAYRKHYRATGMAASVVYPGIRDLLTGLRERGFALAVATQKPGGIARELLGLHGLAESFDTIQGSPDDESSDQPAGAPVGKREIIANALAELGLGNGRADVTMVGDRYQDVEGATANGLPCVGVAWGFAADGELETAGAVAVVGSVRELLDQLSRTTGRTDTDVKETEHGIV